VLTESTAVEYGGAPGSLITVSDLESIISVNPVGVKREHIFGVLESQQWQVKVTNKQLALMSRELSGCYAALEGGFPEADEWALLAQGQISQATASTNLTVSLDVDDPLRAVLDGKLARTVSFDTVPSASAITAEEIADSSDRYTIEPDYAGSTEAYLGAGVFADQGNVAFVPELTWKVIFTGATTYKVVAEDGTEQTGYTTGTSPGSDATIKEPTLTVDVLRIDSSGWRKITESSNNPGTFSSGDTFVFYSSQQRIGANDLTPIPLIQELLTSDDFLDLKVFDVKRGVYYTSPLYDKSATWDTAIARQNTVTMKGEWEVGSKIIDMVQEILYITHGSIYTMPSGQLALWEAEPNESAYTSLNGDFDAGGVDILSADMTDDEEEVYNVIQYNYLSLLDGSEVQYTVRNDFAPIWPDKKKVFDIHWRVNASSVNTAGSRAKLRYEQNRRKFGAETTLKGAALDLNSPVVINEPFLGINQKGLVIERYVDVVGNRARLVIALDDFTLGDYAKVTDSSGNIPGFGIDPGNVVAPTGGPYTVEKKVS
jgi:hypothetical protein